MNPPSDIDPAQPIRLSVAINTAGPGELITLYGIGASLAARIIEVREQNGPFRGPDDLAQIAGIGRELAYTLAPHVDWRIPGNESEQGKVSWFGILWGSLVTIYLLWFSITVLGQFLVALALPSAEGRYYAVWVQLWILCFFACFTLAMVFYTFAPLIALNSRLQPNPRHGVWLLAGAAISVVNVVLGHVAMLIFTDVYDLNTFLLSPQRQTALLAGIGMLAYLLPVILVLLNPRYASSRLLRVLVNAAMFLTVPVAAVSFWVFRYELPLWSHIISAAGSVGAMWIGIRAMRGESLLQPWLDGFYGVIRSDHRWVHWINVHLPNPEEQKALLDALRRVHPTSRWQTIGGAVVTGAGFWLLATTASAILEWVVQLWLESGFRTG